MGAFQDFGWLAYVFQVGLFDAGSATLLRFGQQSTDKLFVSHDAATTGVEIWNTSKVEPLVVLKHFGPNCLGVPQTNI